MNIIVGNWKMNPGTLEEARRLASQIEHGLLSVARERVETVLCPPHIFLPATRPLLHFAKLGAQNVASDLSGPYTGEISVKQLKEFNVDYVIVGHSERRALAETDKMINSKVKLALKEGIKPILCVGFGIKKDYANVRVKQVIKSQIRAGFAGVTSKSKILVAYEPVWAISGGLGTGKAVTLKHAREITDFIKSQVTGAQVIYGGSLDAKNAAGFAKMGIGGGLVGGASLEAQDFLKIIKAFS